MFVGTKPCIHSRSETNSSIVTRRDKEVRSRTNGRKEKREQLECPRAS